MLAKTMLMSVCLLYLITGGRSQIVLSRPGPITTPNNGDAKVSPCTHIMLSSVLLKSGQSGSLCVVLDGCKESLQLTAGLEVYGNTTTIVNEKVSNSAYIRCLKYQVPKVDKPEMVYLSLSVTGTETKRLERKPVVIDNMPQSCLGFMEKQMYKPGDQVQCRLVCLDNNLKPTDIQVTDAYLVDSYGARIAQIKNPKTEFGVVSVHFDISIDASSGSYQILFNMKEGSPYTQYFSVDRYILPRFDSTENCPSSVSVLDKTTTVKVSAEYVTGKPLPGTVILSCCRKPAFTYGRAGNCFKGLEALCVNSTGKLDSEGSYKKTIDLDNFKTKYSGLDNSINCVITVKENGTGVLDTKYCYIGITSQLAQLQFDYDSLNQYFKRGIDFPCSATLTDNNGKPMRNKTIKVEVNGNFVKEVTTDKNGVADCSVDTESFFKQNFTLRVSYQDPDQCYTTGWNGVDYPFDEHVAFRFYSSSDSYLQTKKIKGPLSCDHSYILDVDYIVSKECAEKDAITFYYTIIAKDNFVKCGLQEMVLQGKRKGRFQINFEVTWEYAESTKLFVYAPVNGELISDSMTFEIKPCFKNAVSLSVEKDVVAPGSAVVFQVKAAPGSFCAFRSRDVSLDLISSYEPFSPANIFGMFNYYHYGYQVNDFNLEESKPACLDPNTEVYCHGNYYKVTSSPTDGDTYQFLRSISVMAATNLKLMRSEVCGMEEVPNPIVPFFSRTAVEFKSAVADAASPSGQVRSNFNDTYGWTTTITGANRSGTVTAKVPDQITKWNSDAFCTSKEAGLGLTLQPTTVTTTLEFYQEVDVLSFVVRGETIYIDVTTVSNFDGCVKFTNVVPVSPGYSAVPVLTNSKEKCLCQGQRDTTRYEVKFTGLGFINITASVRTESISKMCGGPNNTTIPPLSDTVIKSTFVSPEGLPEEVTISRLISIKDGSPIVTQITITAPENLVPGSAKIQFTVVGDVIGLTADNMENLLLQQGRCCEQTLTPLITIALMTKYFKNRNELSNALFEKAKRQLSENYGRLMNCRNWDGSFNSFPGSKFRNTWFEANVLYALGLINEYTYVDEDTQVKISNGLGQLQNLSTGCISPIGAQFTNQETENYVYGSTCYLAVRMMKINLTSIGVSVLNKAMQCIDDANFNALNTYTQSYLLLAAGLRKQWQKLNTFLTIFKKYAINEGGTTYWGPRDSQNLPISDSSSIMEITTNVLMAIMTHPNKTEEHIRLCSQTAAYISNQMTSRGGLSNSVDTMCAIEALTIYGEWIGNVGRTNAVVVVSKDGKEVTRFNVTEENKLLVQRKLLASYGTYDIKVSGNGNILAQISSQHNIQIPKTNPPFLVEVKITGDCSTGAATSLVSEICISYQGSRNRTNVIAIDYQSFTGYSPDVSALYKLKDDNVVAKVDIKDNHVNVFILPLNKNEKKCFSFPSYVDQRVLTIQNSNCKAYDYYNVRDNGATIFKHPCMKV